MKRYSSAFVGLKTAAAAVSLLIAGLAISGAAQAACTDVKMRFRPATLAPPSGSVHFSDAVYRPGEYGAADSILVSSDQNQFEGAAIVGLWTWEWRALGNTGTGGPPDGALLDFGLIQWHDDGTEITNSGGRTPAVGDVCMGVWRQVGHSTFELTHLALGYGPPPGPAMGYQGLALLAMKVTVASGGHTYHGNFTLTQYHNNFNPSVPDSEFDRSAVDFTLTGTVTATRVTTD